MRNDTRLAFERFSARVAQLSGMSSAQHQFAVEPSVQQTLESAIQESSALLQSINIIGVDEIKGEKLALGVSGPTAARTDVKNNDRAPRDLAELTADSYECYSTEFDTYLRWATLDAWAKFPDFQVRLRNAIIRQQALDRIMVGFNGTSAAVETDRATNPLLQDVNIGWLQKYRDQAAARVISGADFGGVGANQDYANLDALVFDAVNELIEPWHRESTDLVAICGRKLMADKYFPLINQWEQPSEQRALDLIVASKRLGGLQAVRAPFVPDGAILITSLSNLSLYYQNGSRRRRIQEQPERKRVANFESSNEAYVVEDYGFGCLIEDIALADAPAA